MPTRTFVVDKATNRFISGGYCDVPPTCDPQTQVLVTLNNDAENSPDFDRDRYDPVTGIRPATPEELAAADAAKLDVAVDDVTTAVTIRLLTAAILSVFAQVSGRAATADEVAAMLARAKTIYQTL